MSDEAPSLPESSENPAPVGPPRVRRISNRLTKKPTKDFSEKPIPATAVDAPGDDEVVPAATSDDQPEATIPVVLETVHPIADEGGESDAEGDWPEPEAPSSGGQPGGGENNKRKRRRKKGKGGGQQHPPAAEGEPASDAGEPQRQSHQPPVRVKVDAETLSKFAWKIYLAEVSEEGVALINDHDAKELSRRCFRLAEIFLEEQGRRR